VNGRIIQIDYFPNQSYSLENHCVIDLKALETACEKKGVLAKVAKSCIVVRMDNVVFQVFASGKIGLCHLKTFEDIKLVDGTILNFFWKNFAKDCVVKGVVKNG
jgi:hypothetical protein